MMIDQIITKVLPNLEELSHVVKEYAESEEVPESNLEQIINHLTTKMLQIASKFPEYRQTLIGLTFTWANSFILDIEEAGIYKHIMKFGVAALVGLFRSIKLEYAWVFLEFDEQMSQLFTKLTSDEFRSRISSADSEYTQFTKIQLYIAVFDAGKEYVASLLLQDTPRDSNTSFEYVWEELISETKYMADEDLKTSLTLPTLHKTFSDRKWVAFIAKYPEEPDFLVAVLVL
jgi:hypothetical protein